MVRPFGFGAVDPSLQPHRYWRIYVTAADGGSNIALLECHMRTSKHGANLAATPGQAYTSSSVLSHDAMYAFNGSWGGDGPGAVWASSTNANEWLAYDFGAGTPQAIVAVDMWARQNSSYLNQAPKDFSVQYSDNNSTWTTAWTVTGSTGWRTREHRKFVNPAYTETVFSMGSHTYWRLMITDNWGAPSNTGIGEIEFRSVVGTPQGSTGGTASASSQISSTYSADKAYAGDGGTTFWVSVEAANGTTVSFNQYQHASARTVNQLMLTSRNDAFQSECPKYFQLMWSDDGSTWTHGADCSQTAAIWTANQTILFDVTPA